MIGATNVDMSLFKSDIMDTLLDVARKVQPVAGTKIACALVYKHRIISIGITKKKTHPYQKLYGKNDKAIFLHAEIDALVPTLGAIPRGTILYLARVYKNGQSALVTPCSGCMRALEDNQVIGVFHT